MKWPVETIDVVAQVNPKLAATDRPDLDEIVCFVPMAAVSEETLSIKAQAERPFSEVAKGYTPFKRGDVLVAKITPCFENGKMALADNLAHELGFGTTEFHVFRPSERITGPYLFNLLRAPYVRKAGAMKMKGAAGQRRVPADFFAALQIPLPPLAEQKRIAGILDAADALRAKRREALAQLDTLIQSTFLDMFGDPVTNPMGWEMVNGGRVSRRLTVGIVVKPASYYQPTGVPAIRSLNVRTNKIEIASLVYVSAENNEGRLKKTRVWKDDVLLVRSGQPGTAAVVPAELDGVNAIDILILTPDQHVAHPVYLSNYFNSAGGKRMVLGAQRGQIQKHLNVGSLRSALIPLPPLDLQCRFSAIVESVECQKASQRAHLDELDTLFASLQSRAFRGDL